MPTFLYAVFVLLVAYMLMVSPSRDALEVERKQELSLRNELEHKQRMAANLEPLKRQRLEMEQTYAALLRIVPRHVGQSEILELLGDRAGRHGVAVESLAFSAPASSDVVRNVRFDFTATGGFRELMGFLDELVYRTQPMFVERSFSLSYVEERAVVRLTLELGRYAPAGESR